MAKIFTVGLYSIRQRRGQGISPSSNLERRSGLSFHSYSMSIFIWRFKKMLSNSSHLFMIINRVDYTFSSEKFVKSYRLVHLKIVVIIVGLFFSFLASKLNVVFG